MADQAWLLLFLVNFYCKDKKDNLQIGLLLMVVSSRKFVKKPNKEKRMREAYDGNVWLTDLWDRAGLIFYSIGQIIGILAVVQFSFTTFYGENTFVFIGVMKILGMMLQFTADQVFNNRIFFAPMKVAHNITESMITFGAKDFLDFLVGFFIDLGKLQTNSIKFSSSVCLNLVLILN